MKLKSIGISNFESFGISNFKAFGNDIQRAPLRPITLIFGANSAGKSSFLHGFLWMLEAAREGNFEVHSSKRVSGKLDLGGFQSILRGHNISNKIRTELSAGRLPTGEAIRITYEIGIRTNVDAHDFFCKVGGS
jgi:AAA15 family ATPase/GTPase